MTQDAYINIRKHYKEKDAKLRGDKCDNKNTYHNDGTCEEE